MIDYQDHWPGMYERDYHQEYKDDLAMGRIDRDGNMIEPEPPDCTQCYSYSCPGHRLGPIQLAHAWWLQFEDWCVRKFGRLLGTPPRKADDPWGNEPPF